MIILGIHHGHDSSASLIIDGKIIAAASEERFSRVKNDANFPRKAIEFTLRQGGICSKDIDVIAFASLSTSIDFELNFTGFSSVQRSYRQNVKKAFCKLASSRPASPDELPIYKPPLHLSKNVKILNFRHHYCHATSAYYSNSLFNGSQTPPMLIFTMDGFGEGESATVHKVVDGNWEKLLSVGGEGSVGWFYGNITESLGWRHGSDEWKVMGLAPYGHPTLKEKLIKFCPQYKNGTLNKPYKFHKHNIFNEYGSNHWSSIDARLLKDFTEGEKTEEIASSAQALVEDQMREFIIPWVNQTGIKKICCAGGAFLNIKFNQKLWETGILENQWVFPESGDAGLSLGAAFAALKNLNKEELAKVCFHNAYLGEEYTKEEIVKVLSERCIPFRREKNPELYIAQKLSENKVVGWFNGRFEYGPRALGARSILMSPIKAENKDIINLKIKFRESFRPFCPSILEEYKSKYLKDYRDEFYMISSFKATEEAKKEIPAVVHIDGTLRPQMVKEATNKKYFNLLKEFQDITGIGAIMNTSFNVKGEPIVSSPIDAIKCFYSTGIDVLYLQGIIIEK